MKFQTWDPDVETIATRIRDKDLDLQPDFQRNEVWPLPKQQRLIDTILRGWHIPPIHVIESPDTGLHEVLDGQQRLVAIRDFVNGKFSVNGKVKPEAIGIRALDGLHFAELPLEWKRKVHRFTLRILIVSDYTPDEPGELFYRLNQPTYLTTAEQRNAYFGPAREQIRELVKFCEDSGINERVFGFSNARMSYDDVFARVCWSLEVGSLTKKVTADALANRYRLAQPFALDVTDRCKEALRELSSAVRGRFVAPPFNKASLYSWLCVLASRAYGELRGMTRVPLDAVMSELLRTPEYGAESLPVAQVSGDWLADPAFRSMLHSMFDDRASSRVADVTSVVVRDAVLWAFIYVAVGGGRAHGVRPFTLLERSLEGVNVDPEGGVEHGGPAAYGFIGELWIRRLMSLRWGQNL